MKEFLKKLKSFYGIVGSASILIPGISFFFKYTPPLFDQISILVTALSVAFLWLGFNNAGKKPSIYKSVIYISVGLVLTIIYLVLLDTTSVRVYNSDNDIRYQVGWGTCYWSLEKGAIENINKKLCTADNKEDLLYCYTASRDNVFLIWKSWTVYVFGVINILFFTLASVSWSYGWGRLIKSQ